MIFAKIIIREGITLLNGSSGSSETCDAKLKKSNEKFSKLVGYYKRFVKDIRKKTFKASMAKVSGFVKRTLEFLVRERTNFAEVL